MRGASDEGVDGEYVDRVSAPVIAIICARAGSKGLRMKNLRIMAGKPLMRHTIEDALESGVCDVVLVSTDSPEMAAVASDAGAQVLMRPPELGADLVPAEPVVQHALLSYEQQHDVRFGVVVYLQTTDLFRTPGLIGECVKRLVADPSLDSVFSGHATHKNFWRKTSNGYVRVWKPEIDFGPRQTAEELVREDTGIACATRAELVREGMRIGPRVDIVVNHRTETGIDIHTEFDFWLAEKVLTEWSVDSSSGGNE